MIEIKLPLEFGIGIILLITFLLLLIFSTDLFEIIFSAILILCSIILILISIDFKGAKK